MIPMQARVLLRRPWKYLHTVAIVLQNFSKVTRVKVCFKHLVHSCCLCTLTNPKVTQRQEWHTRHSATKSWKQFLYVHQNRVNPRERLAMSSEKHAFIPWPVTLLLHVLTSKTIYNARNAELSFGTEPTEHSDILMCNFCCRLGE